MNRWTLFLLFAWAGSMSGGSIARSAEEPDYQPGLVARIRAMLAPSIALMTTSSLTGGVAVLIREWMGRIFESSTEAFYLSISQDDIDFISMSAAMSPFTWRGG